MQFNIEEIVWREIEDASLNEFGSVKVPRNLRLGTGSGKILESKLAAS